MQKSSTKRARTPRANAKQGRADALTAERVRAVLADAEVGETKKKRLRSLVADLNAVVGPDFPRTPEVLALTFAESARLTRERPKAVGADEAARLCEQITQFAERHEPEEYKVARRCVEIYTAEIEREGDGEGYRLIMAAADAVTAEGGEEAMLSSPQSKFFVPFFAEAARDLGPNHHAYVELKDLIRRVDEGADLDALAAEQKRETERRDLERESEEREQKEPKDKTSDKWRYWKLRNLEHALSGKDPEAFQVAQFEVAALVGETLKRLKPGHTSTACAILPDLIIDRQREQKAAKKGGGR